MTDAQPYQPYVPGKPASPAEGVAISEYLADSESARNDLVRKVRARLPESEQLICVLTVSKIQPSLNLLVVTSERVLAGWRDDLPREDFAWRVDLAAAEVADVEVTGFMDNVRFVGHDGDGTKVGNLRDADDEPVLREALARAQAGTGRGPDEPPPTYEVYRA